MRVFAALLSLSLFIACENPCWENECYNSTAFRFNLLDSAGNDLFFGENALYYPKQLQIKDSLNNSYLIETRDYGNMRFMVELSGAYSNYQISLKGSTLDFFSVKYELIEEDCCDLTPWLREVEFQQLRTALTEDKISTNIYLQ